MPGNGKKHMRYFFVVLRNFQYVNLKNFNSVFIGYGTGIGINTIKFKIIYIAVKRVGKKIKKSAVLKIGIERIGYSLSSPADGAHTVGDKNTAFECKIDGTGNGRQT